MSGGHYLLSAAVCASLHPKTRNLGRQSCRERASRDPARHEAEGSIVKLPVQVVNAIASPSNAPVCRLRYALYGAGVSQRRSGPLHLSLALANRSRYLFCCRDWVRLDYIENSSLDHRQRLCPNDITDTITDITDITDIIPDVCSASWTADLVARLVPLAAPRWFHVVAHQNDVQVNPSRYSRPWRCSGRSPVLMLLLKIVFGRVHYDRRSSSYGELDAFYHAAPPSRGIL
ncbi:hypothetical protein SAMN05216348_105203 [Olsenella sp. KH3B4]|nr:hypothetical protein SAMN05216348_105203 [Olsenella sp. KH3B4]